MNNETINNYITSGMLLEVAMLTKDLTEVEVQEIRIVQSDGIVIGRIKDFIEYFKTSYNEFVFNMLWQPTVIKGKKIIGSRYEILISNKIIIIR